MQGVRIFESDARGFLVSMPQAPQGQVRATTAWMLQQRRAHASSARSGQHAAGASGQAADTALADRDHAGDGVGGAAQARPHGDASTCSSTSRHLEANGQTSQRYEIEFWRKVFYPLSCLVMVVLALPFAYLHFRSGGITS